MKRLFVTIIFFFGVALYANAQLKYHTVHMPDTIPEALEDVCELKAIVSGGWSLPVKIGNGVGVMYPAYVGYRVQEDMRLYTSWPSIEDAIARAERALSPKTDLYFSDVPANKFSFYYYDPEIKVFIYVRKLDSNNTVFIK